MKGRFLRVIGHYGADVSVSVILHFPPEVSSSKVQTANVLSSNSSIKLPSI